jgi:hypothetical protein
MTHQPGRKSPSQYNDVPQDGQKWKRTLRPSCPSRSKTLRSPSIATSDFSKIAPLPANVPVLRWQSRQWHKLTMRGSPDILARSDPQWHSASLFICHLHCIDRISAAGAAVMLFRAFWGSPDGARLRPKSQDTGPPACQRCRTQGLRIGRRRLVSLEAILPDAAGVGAARNRPGGSILAAGNRNGAEAT